MKHAASRVLYAHWNTVRGERAAATSLGIDPLAIAAVLADVFFVDVEMRFTQARPRFTIRLSGTRLNALMNRDLAGSDLLSLWRAEDRFLMEDLVLTVMDDARPIVAGCAAAPSGQSPVNLELMLLPLRHGGKTHSRVLGALSTGGAVPWLGLAPVEPIELRTERILDPLQRPARLDASFSPYRPRAIARRPFTVYEGGAART